MQGLFSGWSFGFLVCALAIVVIAGFRSQTASARESYQNRMFWRVLFAMIVIGYILIKFVLPALF